MNIEYWPTILTVNSMNYLEIEIIHLKKKGCKKISS